MLAEALRTVYEPRAVLVRVYGVTRVIARCRLRRFADATKHKNVEPGDPHAPHVATARKPTNVFHVGRIDDNIHTCVGTGGRYSRSRRLYTRPCKWQRRCSRSGVILTHGAGTAFRPWRRRSSR